LPFDRAKANPGAAPAERLRMASGLTVTTIISSAKRCYCAICNCSQDELSRFGAHLLHMTLRHEPTGGLPLGIMSTGHYQQGQLALGSGDLLVVFTDGVIEAENEAQA
jgi:hypothetical protein